ncbi:hypothetical protein [Arthrobacter sp. MDT1-65]
MDSHYFGHSSLLDSEIVAGMLIAGPQLSIHSTAEKAAAARPEGVAHRTIITTTEGEYFHVKQGTVASTGVWIEDTYGRRFLTYGLAVAFAAGKGRDGSPAEIVLMTPLTTELGVTAPHGMVHIVGTTTVWEEVPVGTRLRLMPDLVDLVPSHERSTRRRAHTAARN